jgi:hypothetical protein
VRHTGIDFDEMLKTSQLPRNMHRVSSNANLDAVVETLAPLRQFRRHRRSSDSALNSTSGSSRSHGAALQKINAVIRVLASDNRLRPSISDAALQKVIAFMDRDCR